MGGLEEGVDKAVVVLVRMGMTTAHLMQVEAYVGVLGNATEWSLAAVVGPIIACLLGILSVRYPAFQYVTHLGLVANATLPVAWAVYFWSLPRDRKVFAAGVLKLILLVCPVLAVDWFA